jgi:hypothetical protein
MVRRCLERCDEKGIRGSVSIPRALLSSAKISRPERTSTSSGKPAGECLLSQV